VPERSVAVREGSCPGTALTMNEQCCTKQCPVTHLLPVSSWVCYALEDCTQHGTSGILICSLLAVLRPTGGQGAMRRVSSSVTCARSNRRLLRWRGGATWHGRIGCVQGIGVHPQDMSWCLVPWQMALTSTGETAWNGGCRDSCWNCPCWCRQPQCLHGAHETCHG
jgi:hypothetical protein